MARWNLLLCIHIVNAIKNQAVQVDIEIYRPAKALHECHGTAFIELCDLL
jgi:hypothetical protein